MHKVSINSKLTLPDSEANDLKEDIIDNDQVVNVCPDGCTFIFGGGEVFSHADSTGYMWDGDGEREVRIPITFNTDMKSQPNIFLTINKLDSSQAHNLRYNILAEDVSKYGFTIVFKTWSDSRIYSASVSWMVIGSLRADEQCSL